MTAVYGSGLDPASASELRGLVREVLAEMLAARAGASPDQGAADPGGPGRPPGTVLSAGGVPSGIPVGQPSPAGQTPAPAASMIVKDSPPYERKILHDHESRVASDGQAAEPAGAWEVRIGSDEDLRDFALRVLKLAGNPKQRGDLLAGRIRFRLAGPPGAAGSRAVHRVEKGAVTERTVSAAAAAGARLVLGPRAVLTPLGKDKARALGVPIDKER